MMGALTSAINSTNSMSGNATNALYSGITNANGLLQPYMDAGTTGVNNLMSAISPGGSLDQKFSFDPTQIANNPDYQFSLQQGTQAVQRAAAANGANMSGGTLKAIDQYSQGLAANQMSQYYNMALNTFNTNRTSSLQNATLPISIGQGAASQGAGNIMSGSSQIGSNTMLSAKMLNDLLTGKGAVSAAGSQMQGNIWGGFAKSGALAGGVAPIWNAIPGDNTATQAIGAVMGL